MNGMGTSNLSSMPVLLRLTLLAVTLSMTGVLGVTPTLAEGTTVTDSFREPLNLIVFVPCANNGMGELVELSGTLHLLFHTTLDSQGGFHSKVHLQPQGVSGIGLTTGEKYQGTGVSQESFNGEVGFEFSFVNNFKIIGQGPSNNFLVHENIHLTIHPDGTVTGDANNFSVKCKIVA